LQHPSFEESSAPRKNTNINTEPYNQRLRENKSKSYQPGVTKLLISVASKLKATPLYGNAKLKIAEMIQEISKLVATATHHQLKNQKSSEENDEHFAGICRSTV
jgi:hypothetical protein